MIYKTNGLRAIYQGCLLSASSAAISWALFFCFNEAILDRANDPISVNLLKTIFVGISSQMIVNPLWVCKTRICNMKYDEYAKKRKIFLETFKELLLRQGLLNGWLSGIQMAAFGTLGACLQFFLYSEVNSRLIAAKYEPVLINQFLVNNLLSKLC